MSAGASTPLWDEMWSYDADEFAGSDYLSLFPESGKMPLVAGDQVVGAGGVGAFHELIVVGILRDLQPKCRSHELRPVPDELEKMLAKASTNLEFPAC
jgi:hypothetical protein